jgi:hypothetical protein
MPETISVVPAYGRDYKSKAAVEADWNAGKDFRMMSGPNDGRVFNKASGVPVGTILMIRYQRLTKQMALTIKPLVIPPVSNDPTSVLVSGGPRRSEPERRAQRAVSALDYDGDGDILDQL